MGCSTIAISRRGRVTLRWSAGALSALWQAETDARSAGEISEAETLRHLKAPTGRFRRAREVGMGMRPWSADASARKIY